MENKNGAAPHKSAETFILGFPDIRYFKGKLMHWANGNAVIPTSLINTPGLAKLELTVLRTHSYWVDAEVKIQDALPDHRAI